MIRVVNIPYFFLRSRRGQHKMRHPPCNELSQETVFMGDVLWLESEVGSPPTMTCLSSECESAQWERRQFLEESATYINPAEMSTEPKQILSKKDSISKLPSELIKIVCCYSVSEDILSLGHTARAYNYVVASSVSSMKEFTIMCPVEVHAFMRRLTCSWKDSDIVSFAMRLGPQWVRQIEVSAFDAVAGMFKGTPELYELLRFADQHSNQTCGSVSDDRTAWASLPASRATIRALTTQFFTHRFARLSQGVSLYLDKMVSHTLFSGVQTRPSSFADFVGVLRAQLAAALSYESQLRVLNNTKGLNVEFTSLATNIMKVCTTFVIIGQCLQVNKRTEDLVVSCMFLIIVFI